MVALARCVRYRVRLLRQQDQGSSRMLELLGLLGDAAYIRD